ncbi:hypothetical protein QBC38DRAFT_515054 [Podospora fimiseda]|uniref:BTB domain-containing protein n=1 Tax=Podospora fimiseda TaxID=252190 RepID=A0AAN7BJC2_9PEZI|nr:hypothetical protein QBC38DRAFT_515054 [Podospora fimiseda]
MSKTKQLDPDGDLFFHVGKYKILKLQLCSATMRGASRVWKAMLFSGWKESKPSDGTPWVVSLPEDEPSGMLIVLAIIHGQNEMVPQRMDLELLYEIFVVVDKYLIASCPQHIAESRADLMEDIREFLWGRIKERRGPGRVACQMKYGACDNRVIGGLFRACVEAGGAMPTTDLDLWKKTTNNISPCRLIRKINMALKSLLKTSNKTRYIGLDKFRELIKDDYDLWNCSATRIYIDSGWTGDKDYDNNVWYIKSEWEKDMADRRKLFGVTYRPDGDEDSDTDSDDSDDSDNSDD